MTIDAYGRDAHLLLRRRPAGNQDEVQDESSGGFIQIPFFSATLGVNQPNTSEAKLPSSRLPSKQIPDLADASGSIVTCLDSDAIGWHLCALFGLPQTTGSADPYTHVWTLAPSDLFRHDVYLEDRGLAAPLYTRHEGLVWNTMQLNVAKSGAAQRVTFGVLGEGETVLGTSGDAAPLLPQDPFEFRSWQGSVSVEGIADGGVTACDFTINNGLEPDQGLLNAKATPAGYLLGDLSGAGTLTVRHRSDFYDAIARSNANFDLNVGYVQSPERQITMRLHNCVVPRVPREIAGAGVIERRYGFALDEPDNADTPVTVTLVNGRANWDMPA
ncbi:MAG: phage tail tube protein [Pseudomonadota bacterium]